MLHNKNFLLDSNISLNTNYTSPTIDLTLYYGLSVQASWEGSGGGTGTIGLQVSNDGINYDTVTNSPTTLSGTGTFFWDVTNTQAKYMQVYFTYASGSGTTLLSIKVNGKTL